MSLFTTLNLPDWYYVCLINSHFISLYVDNFINNTSHFQINDARQLPVIIPSERQLNTFRDIFFTAEKIKKQQFSDEITPKEAEELLDKIQVQLDLTVCELYAI